MSFLPLEVFMCPNFVAGQVLPLPNRARSSGTIQNLFAGLSNSNSGAVRI